MSFSRPSTFYPRPSILDPRQKPTLKWECNDSHPCLGFLAECFGELDVVLSIPFIRLMLLSAKEKQNINYFITQTSWRV